MLSERDYLLEIESCRIFCYQKVEGEVEEFRKVMRPPLEKLVEVRKHKEMAKEAKRARKESERYGF